MTITADSVLRAGLAAHDRHAHLTLDPRFQGLPDTAHGGTVLAAFAAAAALAGRQRVRGVYRKRVPLGVRLRLAVTRRDGAVDCGLFDDTDALLAEGDVAPAADTAEPVAVPTDAGTPLPISSTCFACGVDNALGLRAQLGFDEGRVWTRWNPPDTAIAADGTLAPVALAALLDEAAFWLGALASGESGVTTELGVTLEGPVAFGTPIVVVGERSRTRPRGDDGRFWDTRIVAADAGGRPLASAQITFVAVRGAARRLVGGLLAMNPPDVLRRVFPAYTS